MIITKNELDKRVFKNAYMETVQGKSIGKSSIQILKDYFNTTNAKKQWMPL